MSRKKKRDERAPAGDAGLWPWTPPIVAGGAAVIWTALAGAVYWRKQVRLELDVWSGFFDLLGHYPRLLGAGLFLDLLHAAGLWALAWRAGRFVLGKLSLDERTGVEGVLLASALGLGAIATALFGLGILHLWNPLFLSVLFYVCFLALTGEVLYKRFNNNTRLSSDEPVRTFQASTWHWGELTGVFLITCAVLLNVMASQAPEIFYDSLVYHLALPKLYLLRNAIVPTPENVYSGIPLGLQMPFGWALALRGENLAALIHASCGIGAAGLLWAWARRYARPATGLLAATIFMLAPLGMYAAWHCGVDLGSSFYVAAAALALSRLLDGEDEKRAEAWAIACGLLTGFAMATKYNVFPVGVFIVMIAAGLQYRMGRPFKNTARLTLAAGAALSPWLIKNVFFYGNPLYPFLNNVIGWAAPADWTGFVFAAGSRPLGATFGSWAGFKDALFFPWTASTSNWPLGDWPGPAFIFLVPWALLMHWGLRKDGRAARAVTAVGLLALGGYVSWLLASRLVRYVMPSLPLIALVAALAVDRSRIPSWARRIGWAAALAACVYGFQAAFRQGIIIGQWHFLHGKEARAAYLMRQRTTYGLPYYSAAEWLNKNAPDEARVLVLGESRAFYLERDFLAATVFDHHPFWLFVEKKAQSGKDIAAWMKARGLSHVLLSAGQMHYRNDSNAIFPKEVIAKHPFGEFWAKWLDLKFEDKRLAGADQRWLAVYALRKEPKLDPPTYTENPAREVLRLLGYKIMEAGGPKYRAVGPTRF